MKINLTGRIDAGPVSPFQIRVVVFCAFVALLDGLDIQTMAIATPRIAQDWGMEPAAFGPVISASFAGIMLGTMLLGQLGDRIGRRRVVLSAFLVVGLASILTAMAGHLWQLVLLRFITGFAIGGCLPNVTALATEYVPARRAGLAVTLMYSAVPLGGVVGSLAAADLIALIDWQGIFLLGGILPLLICLALFMGLPESARFLVGKGGQDAKIGAILSRIDPDYSYSAGDSFALETNARKGTLADLFREGRHVVTLLLWFVFFFSMAVMYLMNSWLPSIFAGAGWTMSDAIRTLAFFQVGGIVGGLLGGWLLDRIGPYKVLVSAFGVGALAIGGIGIDAEEPNMVRLFVALAGFGVVGAQLVLTALSAIIYPTAIRATGIGWALGVGRLGAVASPMLGGLALSAGIDGIMLLLVAAAPTVLCCLGALALGMQARKLAAA